MNEANEQLTGTQPDVKWRFFWLMLLLVPLPMLIAYFINLWSRPSYRYFPFVLLAAGWLIYTRWDYEFKPPRGWFSWTGIGFGFVTIIGGAALPSPWLSAVGFVAFATIFMLSCEGPHDRSLTGLALLLLMLLNLPLGYDQLLVIKLQQITTSLSSVLLDVVAVPHAVANNVIQLTTRELFVAEACSGIQSVFTLIFLAMLLVAVNRRPLWLAPVYMGIATVLAVAANVLRVSTVAMGDVWLGFDLASGWQHEVIGYAALGIGVLFLLSFDQFVVAFFHPVDPIAVDGERNLLIEAWNFLTGARDDEGSIAKTKSRTSVAGEILWNFAWSRSALIALSATLCIASLVQAVSLRRPMFKSTGVIFEPDASIFDRPFKSISFQSHELMREGSNPRLGQNADIWDFDVDEFDRVEAQFVLSQPYSGWHELCLCYMGAEWILLNRNVRGGEEDDYETDDASIEPFAFARFKKGEGNFGYLLYSGLDQNGDIVNPPPTPGRLGMRFVDHLIEPEQTSDIKMVQMFVTTNGKLPPELLRDLSDNFLEMRGIIRDAFLDKKSPDSLDGAVHPDALAPAVTRASGE